MPNINTRSRDEYPCKQTNVRTDGRTDSRRQTANVKSIKKLFLALFGIVVYIGEDEEHACIGAPSCYDGRRATCNTVGQTDTHVSA